MKTCKFRFWSLSGSVLFCVLASNPTAAQIIPDSTLPNNSIVAPQGNTRLIEGGTRQGDNLFHSFREFSLSTGDTAFFNNDLTVRNLIARVTGGSLSNIDGMIRANGTANLFFINPSGIIFGPNASLQIGGSFVASTANSLRFADGTEFSATAPQTSPLLTVSVPVGLQFGSNPGEIVNQSQARVNNIDSSVGLQVPSGRTLALVGGKVSLVGGRLTAIGGRVELGSVAGDGFVNLSEIETGYAFGYTNIQNFGNIELSQGAQVDASDFASDSDRVAIQVQGRNITVTENSLIFSFTFGAKTGGNLVINAAESVKVSGGSNIATFAESEGRTGDVLVRALNSIELVGTASDGSPSVIGSQVCVISSDCQSVTGNGGNVTVETERLLIQNGAAIDASTFGAGSAGNVLVMASDIELVGRRKPDYRLPSGIFAQVANGAIPDAGNAGTLTIEAQRLTVQDGAQISTAARYQGNGGDLTINASDSILLSGTSPLATADPFDRNRSGIFVSAELGKSPGNVGNLNITTGQLTVENGARISADNGGSDNTGGSATLNVRQLIIRNGGQVRSGSFDAGPGRTLTVNATESVQVIGSTIIGSTNVPSELFTEAQSSGNAGNLNINTDNLSVRDGAQVTVSSTGSGQAGEAGTLVINARSIQLDKSGSISADTKGGGGDIEVTSPSLIMRRGSSITTNAKGSNIPGGNITLNTDVLVALENSDITANSEEFQGGNVTINTQAIFGTQPRDARTNESDITATGRTQAGTITINTPDVDPSSGLIELPESFVDASSLVDRRCSPSNRASRFVVTGSGGLPASPIAVLSSDAIDVNWVTLPEQKSDRANITEDNFQVGDMPSGTLRERIVEAQGWVKGPNGEIILTATPPTATPHNSWQRPIDCP